MRKKKIFFVVDHFFVVFSLLKSVQPIWIHEIRNAILSNIKQVAEPSFVYSVSKTKSVVWSEEVKTEMGVFFSFREYRWGFSIRIKLKLGRYFEIALQLFLMCMKHYFETVWIPPETL